MRNKILTMLLMLVMMMSTNAIVFGAHTHSWGSSYKVSNATCTSAPKYERVCSVCYKTERYSSGSALGHNPGSGPTCTSSQRCTRCNATLREALGHTGGSLGDGYNSNLHWKYCSRCGTDYGHKGHGYGKWYTIGSSMHKRDCSTCANYQTESHDNTIKKSKDDDFVHETYCSKCNQQMPDEKHPKWVNGEEPSKHKCSACNDEINEQAKWYHRYPGLSSGYIQQTGYDCDVCGAHLSILNGTYTTLHKAGLPEYEYVASDASIKMKAVPVLQHGKYTLYWTCDGKKNPKLRDGTGNIVTPKVDPSDVAIYSWSRKNLKTHAQKTKDYAKKAYDAQIELNGVAVMGNEVIGSSEKDLYKTYDMIDKDINRASSNIKQEWNGVLYEACKNVYRDGGTYEPTITQPSPSSYELEFKHPAGGWIIQPNMYNSEPTLLDSLFRYGNGGGGGSAGGGGSIGGVPSEPAVPWTANIYYCYRILDKNTVPKNGYKALYLYDTVTVYNNGPKGSVEVSIPADMNLIDKTGYRYVGYAKQVSSIEKIKPATKPEPNTSGSPTAKVTVEWDANKAAAIVTFFVEPVKLSWGHKAVNYNGVIIDINSSLHEGKGLEFPDYFDGTRCYIPLSFNSNKMEPAESLHKFYWPGYILKYCQTYKEGTTSVIAGSRKDYNDNETTNIDGSPPRYIINERVPSFYSSEARGYAADKNFNFFYNTPTIEIEHLKYRTNQYMKTTNGKDIKYLQQIINQFAYIDSLITDNVKEEYTMNASTATGKIEKFTYSYPRYDLVQVKIYEIKNGNYNHYATLYADEDYNKGEKTYKIEDYQGVFAKYYSESLNGIAAQIRKKTDIFNTNKNWKVEFIYDEVERVYIKFKDLKGNSIFIRDPKYSENSGRYIGEITEKIPAKGYSYTATDLGENGKFKLISYTENSDGYIDDSSKAKSVTSAFTVSARQGNGDKYIIFYYNTDNTLTVEYRDLNENKIKDNYVTEIDTTGAVVKVPNINLYEVVGYTHNPNYKGVTTTTSGDMRELTSDDREISISSPEETNHQVIIYYKSNEALKVEYRDINGDTPINVPPEYLSSEMIGIPELGIRIPVPTVPGYKVKYYLKNEAYNGTDTTIIGNQIPVIEGQNVKITSNGNNQFIIIYYEKVKTTTDLVIEFRENSPSGKTIKDTVKLPIPVGEETNINIPTIEGYSPKSYTKNGGAEIQITIDTKIIVVGDQNNPQKIIIIYSKNPDDNEGNNNPTIITPDDNIERVFVKANTKGNEEYDAEAAIPTSEDLYVSGDLYSYRFVSEVDTDYVERVDIKVKIIQEYYTDLGDTSKRGSIDVTLPVTLEYNYYDILKAELYDLKAMTLENNAIKYYNNYNFDTNSFGGYSEGSANFPVSKKQPYLEINIPTGVGANSKTSRVQINTNGSYEVEYINGVYEIKIKDVDYYEAVDKRALENQLKTEAKAIVEKCTNIKVQKLTIKMDGEKDVDILTGKTYPLPQRSEKLKSTDYYVPYVAGRAPLYSFYHNKDLYVREEAENKLHISKMAGDYRLIEELPYGKTTTTKYNPVGKKLSVDKINANSLNVHTPIINKTTFKLSDENSKANQLNSTLAATIKSTTTVVNLEEKFTIEIPNIGNHINNKGYGDNMLYNHGGLTKNGTEAEDSTPSRVQVKSDDVVSTPGGLKARVRSGDSNLADTMILGSAALVETEQFAKGPSFAEYKIVRFPYDVYLAGAYDSTGNKVTITPQLFKAGYWYDLYEFVKPSICKYEFTIPTWVQDATAYEGGNGIHVLVVAENCSLENLINALKNPLSVKTDENNEKNKNSTYILRKSYDTYVSGRLYDLQIRDTDDPGFMGKIKPALGGEASPTSVRELPLGQANQVQAYKLGVKLGYRFYFDLKTKGISNENILIKPKIYYVSQNGNVTDDISLFYNTKSMMYTKLTEKDLNIRMTMAGTHGIVNNAGYTQETISAKQLEPNKVFTTQVVIGNLTSLINLVKSTQKLPYDTIAEQASKCGFGTDIAAFLRSAKESLTLNPNGNLDENSVELKNIIKNSVGHWYGEYYLPASTNVYAGKGTTRDQVIKGTAKALPTGYLVVVFEDIQTEDNINPTGGYLTYSAPATPNSQWEKEGIETTIVLPNDVTTSIPTSNLTNAGAMAIYQVGLRANNDFETEGTH